MILDSATLIDFTFFYGFLAFLKFCLGGLRVAFILEKCDSILINSVWILWSFCWILCINSPLCELWKVFSLKSWSLFAQFLPILVFSKDSRELLCRIFKLFMCISLLLHNSGLQLLGASASLNSSLHAVSSIEHHSALCAEIQAVIEFNTGACAQLRLTLCDPVDYI